jgi:RNA-directed DNA polymerase
MQNMKRYGNLFNEITDINNILLAHVNARHHKTHYPEVRRVDQDPVKYAQKIQQLLKSKTFRTSQYTVFWKNCGTKSRWIYKLPYFPDRIVQHAIMQVLEPLLIPCLIRDTFQSLKGRGNHDARKRVEKAFHEHNPAYALKFDIAQFYPSISNVRMREIVRTKIKCADTLWLLDDIIDSTAGLPVGNYSSQILGNLYLNGLDHYAKETLGIKFYYRYCDDILVLCDSAEQAHTIREQLFAYIRGDLKLEIKSDWRVYPTRDGVDYVGWIFHSDRTLLRRRIVKNFARKTRLLRRNHRRIHKERALSSLMSYWGMIKYTNSKRLWKRCVDSELITKMHQPFKSNPLEKLAC